MTTDTTTAEEWARDEFGSAELGDTRRTARLVRMAGTLAARPAGRITQVFRTSAERQGAYDLLSSHVVDHVPLVRSMGNATVKRCSGSDYVHVAVDGTSLKLTDRQRNKDFGAIGSTELGARGLKVVHSYAIGADGVPLGVLDQQWWCRVPFKKRSDCQHRPLEDKETRHWVETIECAATALSTAGVRAWFQIDREADRYWTLKTLHETGQWFTVRSTYAHRFVVTPSTPRSVRLRDVVRTAPVRHRTSLRVNRTWKRAQRTARLEIRTSQVVLDMREAYSAETLRLPVHLVDVVEVGTTPSSETPIHWRLLTNHPIATRRQVNEVIQGYATRWRIEDLHRAWKSGVCRVENAQLRSAKAMMKWAVISVAVAARIERLKVLARTAPETPVANEFTPYELQAIQLLRRRNPASRDGRDAPSSLQQAVRWIAELGGYVGHKSSGPPGATTLRRGFEVIAPVAKALQCLESDAKLR